MRKTLIFILTIIALTGCLKNNDYSTSGLRIRVANTSQFNYTNIIVNTSTGNVYFDDLKSGQKSKYNHFEIAYRYAFIKLEINNNTFTLRPIDYVGETPLKNGNYTYQINANDSQERYKKLSLTLTKD